MEIPRLNNRKLVILQIAFMIHSQYILYGRYSYDFDNFNQLINRRISVEQYFSSSHFGNDACGRPHVNGRGVISGSEY